MSKIEGTVVGPQGDAIRAGMSLFRRNRPQALTSSSHWTSDADGRFQTTSLGPGDYTIRAIVQPAGDLPGLWASADVSIGGPEPVVVNLTLAPAMVATGRIVFESAGSTTTPDASMASLSLVGEGAANAGRATVDSSGSFTIDGITPGTFRLRASVPGRGGSPVGWFVRNVTYGGRDVTDLPIEIAGGEAPSFVVTFTDRTSELSGTLTDAAGRPATDYFVVVLAADQRYWTPPARRVASTRPDVRGRYLFPNLPAGDYRLAVITDLVPHDLQDVNALAQIAAQATPVRVVFGEQTVFDIRLGAR
jgi:hypothetical protein